MNSAIILSGGTGTRLGASMPKQYIKVNGKMLIEYCMNTILSSPEIDAVCIVAAHEWQEAIRKIIPDSSIPVFFAYPGDTRQLSILSGLYAVRSMTEDPQLHFNDGDHDNVLIHDAARPFISHDTISEIFSLLKTHEGVVPVLPMKDTCYLCEDTSNDKMKKISALIPREKLFAGQAPEGFHLNRYIEANESLIEDVHHIRKSDRIYTINGSTEPAVMYGMDVITIPGDERNYKITTHEDLVRFMRDIDENEVG